MPGLASTRVALRALESRNYRLYLSGQVVSVTGTWMQNIAQAWLVLQLSDSPLALGTIASVQFTPMLLFSLFGGVFADRLPKVKVLWVTQSIMAAQALTFATLTITGVINLPLIYVLAGILGLASAVDQPTRQAMLMELVGPENLPNAIALNSIQFNVARIVGPAIGGVAIATLGIAGALYFNALSFVATIVALALMDKGAFYEMPPRIQGRVLSQLREGISYALKTPDIALIVIVLAFMGTFAYNWNVMMPLVAKYLLHAGPSGFRPADVGDGRGFDHRRNRRRLCPGALAATAVCGGHGACGPALRDGLQPQLVADAAVCRWPRDVEHGLPDDGEHAAPTAFAATDARADHGHPPAAGGRHDTDRRANVRLPGRILWSRSGRGNHGRVLQPRHFLRARLPVDPATGGRAGPG